MSDTEDLRIVKTRKLLFVAMKELLHEKDIGDIKVQEIAKRAEINRATFYDHFNDKLDLFDYMIEEEFYQTVSKELIDDKNLCISNVRELITSVLKFLEKVHSSCPGKRSNMKPFIESKIQEQIYKIIFKVIRKTSNNIKIEEIDTLSAVVSWSIYGSSLHWILNRNALSLEEQAESIFQLLLPIMKSKTALLAGV